MANSSPSLSQDALRFGRFELQRSERRLMFDGRPVVLGARAFDVLVALAERPGELVGKNDLLDRVWPGLVVEEANIPVQIGALRKVLAYSRFSQKEINIALAREALKDLLSIQNRQISVENIQKTVADYYKIKVADMYSKKRPASIARPRQIAMYLAKELTQKSLPEIGELFGGRDHTTVLHAVRKIASERQNVTELNQQLHVLEQTLKG